MKTVATCVTILLCHILTATVCLADGTDVGNASRTGSFTGVIWRDANDNGMKERREAAVPHATVKIKRAESNVVYALQSDANGYFIAKDLPHGAYRVWNENQNQRGTVVPVAIGEVNATQVLEIAFAGKTSRVSAPLSHCILLPIAMR